MVHPNTPILIGAGLTVNRNKDVAHAKPPLDLLVDAARAALADTTQEAALRDAIDAVAGLRFVTASPEARRLPGGHYSNPA